MRRLLRTAGTIFFFFNNILGFRRSTKFKESEDLVGEEFGDGDENAGPKNIPDNISDGCMNFTFKLILSRERNLGTFVSSRIDSRLDKKNK
jgi:hypothetical protein